MNRTLKRPMFRMGGSAAEGITSGLDKPKRGLVNEPGKYSQPPLDLPDLLGKTREQMTPENIAAYQPYIQRPRGEALNRFLINFGLDLASRPPTGRGFSGLIATAAGAAKDPTKQLYADLDQERLSKQAAEADLFKTLLQGNIDIAAEAAGADDGGAGKTYAKLEIGKVIKSEIANLADLNKQLEQPGLTEEAKSAIDLKIKQTQANLDFLTKENATGKSLMSNTDFAEDVLDSIITVLEEETNEDGSLKYKGDEDPALLKEAYRRYYEFFQKVPEREANADGGRIGYNVGGPTTTDQETMPTRKMPIDYDTLRARLPKEITDDVVRLIAASPEALEDFATIATQQDVDQFNQKYSVNLVLPQEA
jgi:hypothetical protein